MKAIWKALAAGALAAWLAGCEGMPAWPGLGPGPVGPPASESAATQPAEASPSPAPVTGAGEALAPPPPAPAAPRSAPRPVPPAAAGGQAVMAYVNDEPIPMDELVRLLVAGHGMPMAQQLIANAVVRQEADREKIAVTDEEVAAEHERTLKEMFGDVQDANQRERLLKQLLERNKVSPQQWDLTMRRNALLAKLAGKRLTISEAELQQEFTRQYERKAVVQHIQTATLSDAQKVLRELASGASFEAMVKKYSVGPTASDDGALAPFGAKDSGTPPAIREAALAMTKAGEVSEPIQVGTAFHLVKLIRFIEPKDVKFEDVKETVRAAVRERKAKSLAQDTLTILIRDAKVLYANPTLKAQADEGSKP